MSDIRHKCRTLRDKCHTDSVGQWLISSSGPTAAGRLALLQWAVFVLPTLFWVHSKRWDFKQTFTLLPTSAGHCLTGEGGVAEE